MEEVGAAQTITASCRHDNNGTWIGSGLGSGHALNRLVEVLIQWITAISGNYDLDGLGRNSGKLAAESAALVVSLDRVAGETADDLFPVVQHHVEYESQPSLFCGPNYIMLDWIVLQNTGPGVRARNKLSIMIEQDGFPPGYAR